MEVEAKVKKVSEDILSVDRYGYEDRDHTLTLTVKGMSHRDFLRLVRAKQFDLPILVDISCLQFDLPIEDLADGPSGHLEDAWGDLRDASGEERKEKVDAN